MKKITFITIFFLSSYFINLKEIYAEDNYFIVTAYYSPLPDQKYYMRWNFEKEKILQWNWTHWASGKKVFSGMLAAPKWYDFWTKIELEWLWVWVVEDRWQAIVKKWERGYNHDRLDVWMWYGDEWLKRALAWWKRKVKWKVIDNSSEVTINYKNHPAPDSAVSYLKPIEKTIFDMSLWKNSNAEDIKKLQEFFKKELLYNWEIDWIYNDEVISIVFDFQLKNSIVKDETDFWAWYWWEKTRYQFKKYLEQKKDITKESDYKKYDLFSQFINTKENIEDIESIFKEIWFYNWNISWDLKNLNKIVLDFQLKENIIFSASDQGAWFFWPKTRAKLKAKYEIYKDEKIELERKKIDLEEKISFIEKFAEDLSEKNTKNILNLKKWDISQEVRNLQEILSELWYFSWNTTAIYWDKTFESVLNFQLDKKIIDSKNDIKAWITSEITVLEIKKSLKELYKNKKLLEESINNEDLKILAKK